MARTFKSMEEMEVALQDLITRKVPSACNRAAKTLSENASRKVKDAIIQSKVSYTGRLFNSVTVSHNNNAKVHVVYTDVPYASSIETGVPDKKEWISPDVANWRAEKEIPGNPTKVIVGKSGGGVRVAGKPYPVGVRMFQHGFEVIQGQVLVELEKELSKIKA